MNNKVRSTNPTLQIQFNGADLMDLQDWRDLPLSQLVHSLDAGVSVNSEDRPALDDEFGVLKTSAVTSGVFIPNEQKAVVVDERDRVNTAVRGDTILVSRMNTLSLVGASAYVDQDYPNLFLPDRLWQLVPNRSIVASTRWLFYVLSSPSIRRKISNAATGTSASMKNIAKPSLLSIKVPVPPSGQQERISAILSAWDRAIDRSMKRISAAQWRRSGLMRLFLCDEVPLFESDRHERRKLPLSAFLQPKVRAVPKPVIPFLSIGIRSHCKGTFQKPDFDPKKIDLETLFLVRKNDLIVNITFAWEGAIAIVGGEDDGALVSHRFPTFEFATDIVAPQYFKYVIQQDEFVHKLGLISPGGAGRNRVLNKTDFMKIMVSIPDLEEQLRVASILAAIDRELSLLQRKHKLLVDQRRGLMEQLITGKIPVTVQKENDYVS